MEIEGRSTTEPTRARARRFSRRGVLTSGLALAASAAAASTSSTRLPLSTVAARLRQPDTLPYPNVAAGTPHPHIPIDHVVVVMMENHSFDNYLGMLSRRGRPAADGLRFDATGRPINANPAPGGGYIRAFHMPSACQMESEPNQSWNATHKAVAEGTMTGFVAASGDVAMGYWSDADLPFYYSLATKFALANRWFASVQGQTYPNRRFLHAATAYGLVNTVTPGPNDPPPPNGTIFDRLNAYGVSWTNYFTDLPQTAIIPSTVLRNPSHLAPMTQFYADAAAGRLPAVSLVDPDFGLADVVGGLVPGQPVPTNVRAQGQDEENPQNVRFGEAFVAQVVNAVLASPQWGRTLLIWLYDEHGGYYDHVPPPPAVAPDAVAPNIGPTDFQAGYDAYGLRVPAVVVSPWARPGSVSNVVHDHTSILAFVEQKWNLPALTLRDANAASLLDFLDFRRPALLEPPALAPPSDPAAADLTCTTSDPGVAPQPGPPH
jgi:phospholipase C